MTNDAVVTKLLPHNRAEVAVSRMSVCGGNCGSCGGCVSESEIKAVAENPIGAEPGQRVVIESNNKDFFGKAVLVYIMPLFLLLLGYLLAGILGRSEKLCVLVGFLGLVLGGLILVLLQKSNKLSNTKYKIKYIITK